ncbi:OVARIAN TUMOR DOMAIN-containing deubiquitinating enzyme 1-like [Miscanthus floridulus]|uniref:OVARIAN TUMOR DOMAIN-containing deubiquitinating enzyme 1-like n=1 Tax=Miscanthus floridulus TaxID=154761 RepID=UPI00345A2826
MSDPQVLSMYSSDPQNPPHYIGRQNCEPLTRQKFLSLHHNWQQLLDGKKTYLRPPKNNRVAKDNYDDSVFVTPEPPELALHRQGPLSYLVGAAAGIPTFQQQYKILSEHYVCFRPIRNDGSQFYRAFLFSYLENLGKMQCSQAEVTRLMECVARSRENFCRLQWNNAYFSNPEAFFSSVVSDFFFLAKNHAGHLLVAKILIVPHGLNHRDYEFEHLVNSVANGLNSDELYAISLQEISSSRILSLLRLLTEVHIRTHEVDYNRLLSIPSLQFCIQYVRPFGAGIEILQTRALSQALGIPVHVAFVDGAMKDGAVQVQCLDFVPQSESGVSRTSGSLSSISQYYLSSATDKHPVLPAGNLFSSDRMPLVTIFMTAAHTTAILYRK